MAARQTHLCYSQAPSRTLPRPSPPRRLPPPAAFLVVADEAFGRQVPFAFLEKVKEEFFAKWQDKAAGAIAHSLDKSFGPRLKYWMEYCEAHPEELSKVAAVQKKVRAGRGGAGRGGGLGAAEAAPPG